MRILEINKFYFIKGGAEKHFFDVVSLLQKNRHEVAIFSMRHPRNKKTSWNKYFLSTVGYNHDYTIKERIKGIFRMFQSREAKKKINKLLDDFQPDVVHIHNIYHQLSPRILFEIKKRNIPIVMTVHDYKLVNPNYNLQHNNKFYNRCLDGKFYQCFFDKCLKDSYLKSSLGVMEMYWHYWLGTYKKNIDQYIVPSKFAKNILIKRGIPEDKISMVPHFIPTDKNLLVSDNYSKNYLVNKSDEKYCLYVGRIIANKGIEELVNIFSKISGIKLYLAGAVDSNFNKKKDHKENIKYLGHLKQDVLTNYIKSAEFIISSSQLPETFGLIALEANTHGKIFVGYDTGAYSEIINNGENGILVNNNQEMTETIKNFSKNKNNYLSSVDIKNRAMNKYSEDIYYKRLTNIFKSVIIKHQIRIEGLKKLS